MPMIEANKKNKMFLEKVLCIYYLLRFRKDKKNKIRALINLSNKINAMILGYIEKIGLKIRSTNIKAQKIDGSIIDIFEIVFASF